MATSFSSQIWILFRRLSWVVMPSLRPVSVWDVQTMVDEAAKAIREQVTAVLGEEPAWPPPLFTVPEFLDDKGRTNREAEAAIIGYVSGFVFGLLDASGADRRASGGDQDVAAVLRLGVTMRILGTLIGFEEAVLSSRHLSSVDPLCMAMNRAGRRDGALYASGRLVLEDGEMCRYLSQAGARLSPWVF